VWTRAFWAATGERAAKTAAQVLAALLAVDGVNLLTLDWTATAATVGLATLLSVATSIGSAGVGPAGTPSLVDDQPGRHALD
jgi:Putative lactococcus lactis phage r1t holin